MKKLLVISLTLALLLIGLVSSTVLAADPTETNVDWDGAGELYVDVDSSDSETHFRTIGTRIIGSFSAKDFDDNPYNYQVDTFDTRAYAYVENGAIDYTTTQNQTWSSMYGPPGENTTSHLLVEDGWGEIALGGRTNYAYMVNATYGYPRTSGGDHMEASAAYYELGLQVTASDGDFAYIAGMGSGTAKLDSMTNEARSGLVRLGWGGGSYTDADYTATGMGMLDLYAEGNNQTDFIGLGLTAVGDGTPSSSSLQFIANFAAGFTLADYSATAQ